MIDVNYHLLTESGAPPPSDYHASFLDLGRLGVVDHEFAGRIASCAGLRNRLVHLYDAIDPEKVHGALGTALRDVPMWRRAVRDYLDREAR